MASEIIVNTIKAPTTGANANKVIIPSGVTLDASAGTLRPSEGGIVQVKRAVLTTQATFNSGTYSNMFSVDITPKYSNSDMYVFAVCGSVYVNAGGSNYSALRLVKDGNTFGGHNTNYHSEIGRALTVGVHQGFTLALLDENVNTSSQITYAVQHRTMSGSGGININDTSGTSFISVMEIAQ